MSVKFALPAAPTPNDRLQRFDARYWNINFPTTCVATIIGNTPDTFSVDCSLHSNADLVGVIWNSVDAYGHPQLAYQTNTSYAGCVLAFLANPLDPYNFTLTINAGGVGYFFRLYPFKVSGANLVPDIQNPGVNGNGPAQSFSIATVFPNGLPVPTGAFRYFVVDFSNMPQGFDYSGSNAPSTIDNLFFSITTANYGLGTAASIHAPSSGTVPQTSITIDNVSPNLRLTAGDQLTWTATVSGSYFQQTFTVGTWTGDGTTSRTVQLPVPQTFQSGGKAIGTVLQSLSPTGSEEIGFSLKSISVTGGAAASVPKCTYPQPEHPVQMASGFDDTYNITPWRQVDQIYKLGYRGRLVMYMGMSHYWQAFSSLDGSNHFQSLIVQPTTAPINNPCLTWLNALFTELAQRGMGFVASVSYEISASAMPASWQQLDYTGAPGHSGYTPPSAFVSPNVPEAITYLGNVFLQILGLAGSHGLPLYFQIGEPWWWDGSYSNNRPAIYDAATTALYQAETGLAAPRTITSIYQQPLTPEESAYCNWLSGKLGVATSHIRDMVKASYPGAQGAILFFTPQIFNPQSLILRVINFPAEAWSFPHYDYVQIEDYDWVSGGNFDLLPLTRQAAALTLGYPLDLIDYFVGFVNNPGDTFIWDNMTIAANAAINAGLTSYFNWAYPQVIRDGRVVQASDSPALPDLAGIPNLPKPSLPISRLVGTTSTIN